MMQDLPTTTEVSMKGNTEKSKHAVYLFEELKKFQKVGILCDVKLPAKLESIQAHKVVLLSARSNSVESSCSDSGTDAYLSDTENTKEDSSDVFAVQQAYSPCSSQQSEGCDDCSTEEDLTLRRQLDIINDLRLNHECCDVRLVTDDDYCDAHRVVLAACSDYFRAMFITSQMMENGLATVKLQGINGHCFRKILGFMYTGEIEFNCFEDTVQVLDTSVYYQISPLVDRCVAYLEKNITPQVCCYLTWISRELALQSLTDSCLRFISNHFTALADVNCEVGTYLEAADLLSCLTTVTYPKDDESMNAADFEIALLSTVLIWFSDNHTVSSPLHEEILKQIRFSLIPSEKITECCDIVMKSLAIDSGYNVSSIFGPTVHKYISEALQYHEQLYAQPLLSMASRGLRVSRFSIVSVDGVMANNRVKVQQLAKNISMYTGPDVSPTTGEEETSPMAIRDPYHSVIELNGFIYVIGGTRNFNAGFSTCVMRYDPRLDVWVRVADMNVPRGDFSAGAVNNCIVVAGGRSRRGYLNTCEMYDPSTNTWKFIAKLPEARYMAATTLVNDTLYISGGFDEHEALDTMLKYNVEKNKWERCGTHMLNERGYHTMIPGPNNKLWVVGGVDHPFSGRNVWDVEQFDITRKRWSYVGQVLAVKPFLSTVRLNSFLNDEGNITISPVTLSGSGDVMVEFQPSRRMWFEMKQNAPSFAISLDEEVAKSE